MALSPARFRHMPRVFQKRGQRIQDPKTGPLVRCRCRCQGHGPQPGHATTQTLVSDSIYDHVRDG